LIAFLSSYPEDIHQLYKNIYIFHNGS